MPDGGPLLLGILLLVSLFSTVYAQGLNSSSSAFSDVVGNSAVVKLSATVSINISSSTLHFNSTIIGAEGVWLQLPSATGVITVENGSTLELFNLGVSIDGASAANVSSLLRYSFFAVQPGSLLKLHNVSMNLECTLWGNLTEEVCRYMPDLRFEVLPWYLRVLSLQVPGLEAVNVTLRCGKAATNSTAPLDFNVISTLPNVTAGAALLGQAMPCAAVSVTRDEYLYRALTGYGFDMDPEVMYALLPGNLTTTNLRASFSLRGSKIVIAGSADVPTQLDVHFTTSLISWPDQAASSTSVVIRDLFLVGLPYGSAAQYPATLVTAGMWWLDFRRYDAAYTDTGHRVLLQNCTVIVAPSELAWWSGMLANAVRNDRTDLEPVWLLEEFSNDTRVEQGGSVIQVPRWTWSNSLMVWEDCRLATRPLQPGVSAMVFISWELLDTLAPFGWTGPVPLSSVKLQSAEVDSSAFNASTVILRADAAQVLAQGFSSSAPRILTSNITIWGDGKLTPKELGLQGLSGVVTVPPYTVVRLRFVTVVNLGVGLRGVEPAALQNYTLMFWFFNRALQPVAVQQQEQGGRRAVRELGGDGSRGRLPRHHLGHRELGLGCCPEMTQQDRSQHCADLPGCNPSSWAGGQKHDRRRRLSQADAGSSRSGNRGGDAGGSSSSSSSPPAADAAAGGSSIPLGPYRPWLQLSVVDIVLDPLEFQLVYELVTVNHTGLRVAPAVVDFFRSVFAESKVSEYAPGRIVFKSLNYMGIEATDVMLRNYTSTLTLMSPQGSILVPEPPPPPRPLTPLSPSPVLRMSPSPQPPPLPVAVQPSPSAGTLGPGEQPDPAPLPLLAPVMAPAPAAKPPIGAVIGAAVGSAVGLILVMGLGVFVFVRWGRRRRRDPNDAPAEKHAASKGGEASNHEVPVVVRSQDRSGGPPDGGPAPLLAQQARGSSAPSETSTTAASTRPGHNQVDIQSPDGRGDGPAHGAPAAAAAAAAAGGAGVHGAGGPAPDARATARQVASSSSSQRAQQSVEPAASRRFGEVGSGRGESADNKDGDRPGAAADCVPSRRGASIASGGGRSVSSAKSRKSGMSAGSGSAGKSAAGSSTSHSGTGSDMASNPRTELYAALAAFQSELGEQQQQIIISCQLGAGAHGVVYKGEWRGLEVAVKTLLFQAFVGNSTEEGGNSFKEQAMLEAAIATTLFHPNVINTFSYDIKPLRMCQTPSALNSALNTRASGDPMLACARAGGIMDWKLYIIQEYCDGGTLKDALDGSRFIDPDTGLAHLDIAVRVAIDISSGMSYIHARNIIHGDLKPANILLRTNTASPYGYTAKIADFGLALKLKAGESHISNIRRGTPFYIAAELVEDGRATTASDLYPFGVILWELLHGCTVARRLPLRRRIPNLPAEFYTWPPDCPPVYRELASACLSSNPATRPRFTDVLHKLTKLLGTLTAARRCAQQHADRHGEPSAIGTTAERGAAAGGAGGGVGEAGASRDCPPEGEAGGGGGGARRDGQEGGDGAAGAREVDGREGRRGEDAEASLEPPLVLKGALGSLIGGAPLFKPIASAKSAGSPTSRSGQGAPGIASGGQGLHSNTAHGPRHVTASGDATAGCMSGSTLSPRALMLPMPEAAMLAGAADGSGKGSEGGGGRGSRGGAREEAPLPSNAGSPLPGGGRDRDVGGEWPGPGGMVRSASGAAVVDGSHDPQVGPGDVQPLSQVSGQATYASIQGAMPFAVQAPGRTASATAAEFAGALAVGPSAAESSPLRAAALVEPCPGPGGGAPSGVRWASATHAQAAAALAATCYAGYTVGGTGPGFPLIPGSAAVAAAPAAAAGAAAPSPSRLQYATADAQHHASGGVLPPGRTHDACLSWVWAPTAAATVQPGLVPSAASPASRPGAYHAFVQTSGSAAVPGASAGCDGGPGGPAAQPSAAVAAAALAALAASAGYTLQSVGVLDSCLGSTDAGAMDRGLMLDLMPALSNQMHSSHINSINSINSALRPDLAVALEKALVAHGIHQE